MIKQNVYNVKNFFIQLKKIIVKKEQFLKFKIVKNYIDLKMDVENVQMDFYQLLITQHVYLLQKIVKIILILIKMINPQYVYNVLKDIILTMKVNVHLVLLVIVKFIKELLINVKYVKINFIQIKIILVNNILLLINVINIILYLIKNVQNVPLILILLIQLLNVFKQLYKIVKNILEKIIVVNVKICLCQIIMVNVQI